MISEACQTDAIDISPWLVDIVFYTCLEFDFSIQKFYCSGVLFYSDAEAEITGQVIYRQVSDPPSSERCMGSQPEVRFLCPLDQ